MLYLHCGWMKTGTTSLRNALAANVELLASGGIVYAQEWRSLTKALASVEADTAIDGFQHFLFKHRDRDVLISNEWLASLVWKGDGRASLLALVEAAAEVMPVRFVWTLRRMDDLIVSLYLWLLLRPVPLLSVDEMAKFPHVESLIMGMRSLEKSGVGESVFVRYDSTGQHNFDLLRAFGVTSERYAGINHELKSNPRLNVALGHKQVAALLNVEALSARARVRLDKAELRAAFGQGGFRFAGEQPCALIDGDVRRKLHDRGMAAAQKCDFRPYLDFFGDAEFDDPPDAPALGLDVLGDEDLRRLMDYVGQPMPSGLQ